MTSRVEQSRLRGLACFDEPFDDEALDCLTRERTSRLVSLYLKRFGPLLQRRAPQLRFVIGEIAAAPGRFPSSWPTAVGRIRGALLEPAGSEDDVLRLAANLAMEYAETGRPIAFQLAANSPCHLRFANYELPAGRSVRFTSDGQRARCELDGESREFVHRNAEWLGGLGHPTVDGVPLLPLALPDGLVTATSPNLSAYATAFQLLERVPRIQRWVRRVLRALVPVDCPAGPAGTTSSSFEFLPGVIALSHESPALALADALVHEASHQHFYLLLQHGPVDDGTDDALYFSPGPRRERPIDKILLAYHAFANVLLFYRACRAECIADASTCQDRETAYEDSLAALERPLRKTGALTKAGRGVFESLAPRLGLKALPRQRIRGGLVRTDA